MCGRDEIDPPPASYGLPLNSTLSSMRGLSRRCSLRSPVSTHAPPVTTAGMPLPDQSLRSRYAYCQTCPMHRWSVLLHIILILTQGCGYAHLSYPHVSTLLTQGVHYVKHITIIHKLTICN